MRSSLLAAWVALAAVARPAEAAAPASAAATAPEAPAAPAAGFLPADPGHAWSFPRDHFARPGYRNEWWYFTGLVTDEDGRRLGFQVTFFRVGLLPAPPALDSAWATGDVLMAHLAVTEIDAGRHRFAEVVRRAAPPLAAFGAPPGPAVAWVVAPEGTPGRWTLELGPEGGWRLAARDDRTGVALALTTGRPGATVLQGPNGYSRKAAAEGFASEYYSQPRLEVSGTIALDGRPTAVRGTAWMDREVGSSQLGPGQVGWDWLALRLADGRDLTLYLLRRADGAVDWRTATLAWPGGRTETLGPGAWSIRASRRWTSPATGATYPLGWRVELPGAGLALEVEPEVDAAENRSRRIEGLFYWEGPVRVRSQGQPAGEGYAELTGYGRGSRLPL